MFLKKNTTLERFRPEIQGGEESGDKYDEILNQLEEVAANLVEIEEEQKMKVRDR